MAEDLGTQPSERLIPLKHESLPMSGFLVNLKFRQKKLSIAECSAFEGGLQPHITP